MEQMGQDDIRGPSESNKPTYGVQVPLSTQPVFPACPAPYSRICFNPVKVPVKVTLAFSVRVFPELVNEEPVPDKVHWLLDTDPDEPGVTPAVNPVPALL